MHLSYTDAYSMFLDLSIYRKVTIDVVFFADTKDSPDSKEWWISLKI